MSYSSYFTRIHVLQEGIFDWMIRHIGGHSCMRTVLLDGMYLRKSCIT